MEKTIDSLCTIQEKYESLLRKIEHYEIILAQTENVLFEWDIKQDMIDFSDTYHKVFGYEPATNKVRQALEAGTFFHPDDVPALRERIFALENGSQYERVEVRFTDEQGYYKWYRIRASAVRNNAGHLLKVVGIIINIDAEKQEERALLEKAQKDALTKLLNKQAARESAEQYLAGKHGADLQCALLIIDLDDFKKVNDQYGHMFGDVLLTQTAKVLKGLFRVQDQVSRIGGDEFMVFMCGTADMDLIANRCARLVSSMQTIFSANYPDLHISCSIGIALGPIHGTSYMELFQYADQALYQAKLKGKNTYVFYDSTDSVYSIRRRELTAANTRIDSDERPEVTYDKIVQYVFQQLYSTSDIPAAINDILSIIGRKMNVSRVYIFENSDDNKYCDNTFEWCAKGITAEIHNLQHVSYDTDIPNYDSNFDEKGIFFCPDVQTLPAEIYDILALQGVKSMLQCAILRNGIFCGYVGFDECATQRIWTKEEIEVLSYFSKVLAVFLQMEHAKEKVVQRYDDLNSILDNQNAWIYIIDPDTCELKYLNIKTKELAPSVEVGMCCYKALMGNEERCANCPAINIRKQKNDSSKILNEQYDMQVMAEATLIQWKSEEACLLTCRKVE